MKHHQSTNIVIEVSPILRKFLLQKEYVFVGWKKSEIVDHLKVIRCFKCCGFGHFSKNCEHRDAVCSKCANNHKFKDCDSDKSQCMNCITQNRLFKKNLPTNHMSNDSACPTFQAYLLKIKSKINYG